MARSKNHGRDASPIASRSPPGNSRSPSRLPRVQPSLVSPPDLSVFQDRRTWHPEGPDRPALRFGGRSIRIKPVDRDRNVNKPSSGFLANRFGPKVQSQTKAILAFHAPRTVLVCVRRTRRKEVLFAKKKAGRSGRQKSPRFTWLSKISCRR